MTKLKPNQFILDGKVITERPILFQTEMVKAILEGRKTETRREIKSQPNAEYFKLGGEYPQRQIICNAEDAHYVFLRHPKTGRAVFIKDAHKIYGGKGNPYGKPGDLLWVRQTWGWEDFGDGHRLTYKTDGWNLGKGEKWKPSIHMPKKYARLWLMVEDVRVERIRDIKEEDCKAEGAEFMTWYGIHKNTTSYLNGFLSIWIRINGDDSWNANPWVWVVKFKVLSTTGRPNENSLRESLRPLREKGKEVDNG